MKRLSIFLNGAVVAGMLFPLCAVAADQTPGRGTKRKATQISPNKQQAALNLLSLSSSGERNLRSRDAKPWRCAIDPEECKVEHECLHCDEAVVAAEQERIIHEIVSGIERYPTEELVGEQAAQLHKQLRPKYLKIANDKEAVNGLYSQLKAMHERRNAQKDRELEPARQAYFAQYGVNSYRYLPKEAQLNADPELFHSDYTYWERVKCAEELRAAKKQEEQVREIKRDLYLYASNARRIKDLTPLQLKHGAQFFTPEEILSYYTSEIDDVLLRLQAHQPWTIPVNAGQIIDLTQESEEVSQPQRRVGMTPAKNGNPHQFRFRS